MTTVRFSDALSNVRAFSDLDFDDDKTLGESEAHGAEDDSVAMLETLRERSSLHGVLGAANDRAARTSESDSVEEAKDVGRGAGGADQGGGDDDEYEEEYESDDEEDQDENEDESERSRPRTSAAESSAVRLGPTVDGNALLDYLTSAGRRGLGVRKAGRSSEGTTVSLSDGEQRNAGFLSPRPEAARVPEPPDSWVSIGDGRLHDHEALARDSFRELLRKQS